MSSASSRPSLLGASVGASVGAITASVLAWPVADLFIAPYLIAEAMRPESRARTSTTEPEARDLRALCGQLTGPHARVCVLAGGTQEGRTALALSASKGRPTVRLSLREATAPHSMQMTLIDQLYKPLACAPMFRSLGVFWLSLFDMLIADHAHTRNRDFGVVLHQLRRALNRQAPQATAQSRPLVIVEHLYVPTGAATAPGGEGLAPMLRALRQFLCAVSIDEDSADVLVLVPHGTAAADAASRAWRGEFRRSCAERANLSDGAVTIALTQSEAVDAWLNGMRLAGAAGRA